MSKKKQKVDTPRKGACYQQVNQPGFIPKKVNHRLRYRIRGPLWELI